MIYTIVTESNCRKAVYGVIAVMERNGHEWMVKCSDDEGFEMSRAGSPLAQQWERSDCPGVVGPYTASAHLNWLAEDMAGAVKDCRIGPSSRWLEGRPIVRKSSRQAKMFADYPLTREDAKLRNAIRYYTGMPCSVGHTDTRLASTGKCDGCRRAQLDRVQAATFARLAA
jgi:hypothetical protein